MVVPTPHEALPTEVPDVIDAMEAPAEATGDGDETALVVPPPEVDEVRKVWRSLCDIIFNIRGHHQS